MLKGMLCVASATMLYGVAPFISKTLFTAGITVSSVLFWRFFLIIPFLFVLAYCGGYRMVLSVRISCKLFVGVAVFEAASAFVLNVSYDLMDTGLATTIYFLYPAIVMLISALVLKKHVSKSMGAAAALITTGMVLVTGQARGSILGIVLALLSATLYAIYLVRLEITDFNKLNPLILTLHLAVTNSVLAFIAGSADGGVQALFSMEEWQCLTLLAFISLAALGLIAYGSRLLEPGRVAVFGLFEPLTSLIVGIVVLHEQITFALVVGCILIFSALVLVSQDRGSSSEGTNYLRMKQGGIGDKGVDILIRHL